MSTAILSKDVKAVSIEYLASEKEMDKSQPLQIGQGIIDNFKITEDLGYKEYFGTKRFQTGLDAEIVQYDQTLDEKSKEIKIEQIKKTIEKLEKVFGKGNLEATNEAFWSKVKLIVDRKTTNLDLSDPNKEILYHCIKGGGFTTVAPSLEEAQMKSTKFYLIEPVEFVENRVSPRKIFNDAIFELQKIERSKSFDDMFYLAKYIMPQERSYTKKTPKSLMYEDLDKFIKGEVNVTISKAANSRQFLEALKVSKDVMIVTDIVKDGIYYGMLYTNNAGEIKNNETGGIYGTSIDNAVKHLLNPGYQHELDNIRERVVNKWSE